MMLFRKPDMTGGLEGFVARYEAGTSADVVEWVLALDESLLEDVARGAREALRALPIPLFQEATPDLAERRWMYREIAAEAEARLGDPEPLIDLLREEWLGGGTPMPLLALLREVGRETEAMVSARLALTDPELDVGQRQLVDEFLEAGGNAPEGWTDAVIAFADAPSPEGWEELLQFTPDDSFYHRVRGTLHLLRRLGVDPNVIFACATAYGVTPDAFELVENGLVDPEVVLARADASPPLARPIWLGMAARAAIERGDRFAVVRLLAEAFRTGQDPFLPFGHAYEIRERADDELHEMLDRAGVPRFDDDGDDG